MSFIWAIIDFKVASSPVGPVSSAEAAALAEALPLPLGVVLVSYFLG